MLACYATYPLDDNKECIRHKVPPQLLIQRVPQSFSRNFWIILTIVKYGKPSEYWARCCEELRRIIGKKGACVNGFSLLGCCCAASCPSPLSSWQQPEEENRYKRVDRLLEASTCVPKYIRRDNKRPKTHPDVKKDEESPSYRLFPVFRILIFILFQTRKQTTQIKRRAALLWWCFL